MERSIDAYLLMVLYANPQLVRKQVSNTAA